MQLLHWIIYAAYTLIVIGVMVKVLMENREPAKTMAWLLVLWALPVVGIVLYFFFGRKTRKERHINRRMVGEKAKRAIAEFAEQQDVRLPEEQRPLMQLFEGHGMARPTKGNSVDIFTDGYQYFPALLREIGKARNHIHIEMFIFSDDALGSLVADALIDRARAGVKVMVIYDDVACWRVKDKFYDRMRRGGIDVRAFMPVRFPSLNWKANYRDHRKLVIIDGRVGFTGGINIARRYVQGTGDGPWRDTAIRITGGAVHAMQRAFLEEWYFVTRQLVSGRDYYPPVSNPASGTEGDSVAQLVTGGPATQWPDIMQGFVRIIMSARHYVFIETPYFQPPEPVLFALRTAALTGVDVRLMIPMKTDSKVVGAASISYVMEIVKTGVKVYLYEPTFNHTKLLVSDDNVSTCGSTNIDFRSFEQDFEANMFFYDRPTALRMKRVFLNDQKHCRLVDEVRKVEGRSFPRRLGESILRLFSPLM